MDIVIMSVYYTFFFINSAIRRMEGGCWKIHSLLCYTERWWSRHGDPGNRPRQTASCQEGEYGLLNSGLLPALHLLFDWSLCCSTANSVHGIALNHCSHSRNVAASSAASIKWTMLWQAHLTPVRLTLIVSRPMAHDIGRLFNTWAPTGFTFASVRLFDSTPPICADVYLWHHKVTKALDDQNYMMRRKLAKFNPTELL